MGSGGVRRAAAKRTIADARFWPTCDDAATLNRKAAQSVARGRDCGCGGAFHRGLRLFQALTGFLAV